MSEIIGTDIKTINLKVRLSTVLNLFGNCVPDIQMYGNSGKFRFALRDFGSIGGKIIWRNDKEFVASIKEVNFDSRDMLDKFLSLIDFAINKGRLDMNLLYDDNHIERVFIQDGFTIATKIDLLVSEYALSLISELPMRDGVIDEFLSLISRLQENDFDVVIPNESEREIIEKVNSCLKIKRALLYKQSELDRAITLYLRGTKGEWVDKIWQKL